MSKIVGLIHLQVFEVDELDKSEYELFHNCIIITFTAEKKKNNNNGASSLHALVNDFKQQLRIPNNVVTWFSKEKMFFITVYCLENDISVKKNLIF